MVDWELKFENGFTWKQWLKSVTAQRERWRDRYEVAWVDDELIGEEYLEVGRAIICIVADDCVDSAGSVPFIARACDQVGDHIDLRILRKSEHPDAMEELVADGEASTPLIGVFDDDWEMIACWGPRPASAHEIYEERRETMSSEEIDGELDAWYDNDEGEEVLAEFIPLLKPPRRRSRQRRYSRHGFEWES